MPTYLEGQRLRLIDDYTALTDDDDNVLEEPVTVPEGTIIIVSKCVENEDEYTIIFRYRGIEFMAPSYLFAPSES